MPRFHETGYGKRFYDAQLPALITALERIGKAFDQTEGIRAIFNEEDVLILDFFSAKAIFAHKDGTLEMAPISKLKVPWTR